MRSDDGGEGGLSEGEKGKGDVGGGESMCVETRSCVRAGHE